MAVQGGPMKTAKEEVRELLEQLPEDASLEDIQYHIYVRQKIQRGLDAASEGKILSQEEVERRMDRWLAR
jgi:predicted transcriptional regulator